MKNNLILVALCSILLTACGGQGQHPNTAKTTSATLPDLTKVSYREARQLVANYAPRADYVIRDGDTLPNSRTVWFPIAQMKALVERLEADNADGLRIYFAAYDSTYTEGQAHVPPEEYWGYNTVLLVSTRDSVANGRQYHQDYYGSGGDNGTAGVVDPPAEIENFGSLCPPPPGCYDEGATLLPPPTP